MRKILQIPIIILMALAAPACMEWGDPITFDGTIDMPTDTELVEFFELPEGTDSTCAPGLTDCSGTCVDIFSDHGNCGACGNECEAFEVCADGSCSLECPEGKIACSGSCVDILSAINNCGRCGNVCTAGMNAAPLCDSGICAVRCNEGWNDLDGDGACETHCEPSSDAEICNGVDDNCDGNIDEGFDCRMGHTVSCATTCGSLGAGICSLECSIPEPPYCTPPAEICNGGDDDCDTFCDNGLECCRGITEFCTTACSSAGIRTCTSTCSWSTCSPPPETCNGADDDCDEACDNGFACCRDELGACTTSCDSTGSRVCSSSCAWGSCTPPAETCNGVDDDCDNVCDNGLACCAGREGSCTTSCHSTGTRTCSMACEWSDCEPPDETCNGADDDCDTLIDEDFMRFQCPVTEDIYDELVTCNSACIETATCTLVPVTAGGDITLKNCDWEGYCSPDYDIGKIVGEGGSIAFYRSWSHSYSLVGSITLSGATAGGEMVLKNCDWEGYCSPDYDIGKIVGEGGSIAFYRSWSHSYSLVGSITLSGATAGGEMVLKNCDWEGYCSPDYDIGRITAEDGSIAFYRSWSHSYSLIGAITLSPATRTCPLGGSYPCSDGDLPSCSAPRACDVIFDCP